MAGNVAFMFLCTIMVLGMTPGLGMFYGGMVRRKNALNTMMFCFAMMGIGMLLWGIRFALAKTMAVSLAICTMHFCRTCRGHRTVTKFHR